MDLCSNLTMAVTYALAQPKLSTPQNEDAGISYIVEGTISLKYLEKSIASKPEN